MAMRTKPGPSAEAFEKLLRALSADRDAAGQCYERIRASLLPFFARRVGSAAESLVDETIDRVCRRLERGDSLLLPRAYFHGVARNVLREYVKAERRHDWLQRAAVTEHVHAPASIHEIGEPRQIGCLQRCLRALPDTDQFLIRHYYDSAWDDAAAVREGRAALARQLGISPGNLRLRAFRARRNLEDCYRRCLDGPADAHRSLDGLHDD